MKIKEEIYRLMDSFLVEGDQPRSIENLNQDRHLFVENMLSVIAKEKMELVERIEEGIRQIAYHFPPYENSIDDQMNEKEILDYLEALKSEIQEKEEE